MKLILSLLIICFCFGDDLKDRYNSLINRDPQVKSIELWKDLLSELKKDSANDEKTAYVLTQLVTKAKQEDLLQETLNQYKKMIQRADSASPKALLNRAKFCKDVDRIECVQRSLAEITVAYPNSEEALHVKSFDSQQKPSTKVYRATVVLDPGHGGNDTGANANQLIEKDLVLDVALRVKELLELDNIKVVMTRSSDKFIPLLERSQIGNDYDANLMVSLHANAGSTGKGGFEFYYYDETKISDLSERENSQSLQDLRKLGNINKNYPKERSRALAAAISSKFELGFSDKFTYTINGSRFYVLQESEIPSVLLELLFVDNVEHAALLGTSAFRQKMAENLSDSIIEFLHD